MRKKEKIPKKVTITLILIMLILTSSFVYSVSYARYISDASDSDELRVAKSGNLKLVEKINDQIEENNLEATNVIDYQLVAGNNLNKEVYLEFTDSEVSTYIFLVVNSINWMYDDSLKEFYIINNKSKLLGFNLNSDWNYLDNLSEENKYIFFYEFDINNYVSTKIDITNEIFTNIIGENDIELLNNSQINFEAYSIQKNNNITVEEAWNYLNS